jgi:chaperonin GroEL (HSP60 family)
MAGISGPLLRATNVLNRLKPENADQRHGVEIVRKAITWPARQIAINAGEDGSIVVGKVLDKDSYAWGFDAQTVSMAISSRRASSIRQRWSDLPCRTQPRSLAS